MEKKMIGILDFNLFSPGVAHFLALYMRVISPSEKVRNLASFLSDLLLLNYESLRFKPSILASACLFNAFYSQEEEPTTEELSESRNHFDWFSVEEFRDAAQFVKSAWSETLNNPLMNRYEAVYHKYDGKDLEELVPRSIPLSKFGEWFYRAMSD